MGGHGIVDVLWFLNGAIVPYEDHLAFMKAQIVYWLLAAIDGHAKNFSIFLSPAGYRITPVYDVMPVLGTAATANNRVIQDVQTQLGDIEIQRGTLVRDSLALQTLRLFDQAARLAWMAQHIPELPGTGIVYVLTIRDAEQVAVWLNQQGIVARAYYGSVDHKDFENSNLYRQHLEDLLLDHEELSVVQLQQHLNLRQGQIDKVLKILSVESPAPVIKHGTGGVARRFLSGWIMSVSNI